MVCTRSLITSWTPALTTKSAGDLHYRGSTSFAFSTAVGTDVYGSDIMLVQTANFDLEPSTNAICTVLAGASVEDEGRTKSTSSTTCRDAQATDKWYQMPITAGAEKLSPATASSIAASESDAAAAAAAAGMVELYKVVVVPDAAALLAGATML